MYNMSVCWKHLKHCPWRRSTCVGENIYLWFNNVVLTSRACFRLKVYICGCGAYLCFVDFPDLCEIEGCFLHTTVIGIVLCRSLYSTMKRIIVYKEGGAKYAWSGSITVSVEVYTRFKGSSYVHSSRIYVELLIPFRPI